MTYDEFQKRLNARIFGQDLNYEILLTVLKNPERYIGLFRITNAKTKLIQNLTQSCEIKFGDFIEEVLTTYIQQMGYENLDKNIGVDEDNNRLNADQFFTKGNVVYLIEQKIRDDHDSTKKRGQYANLIKKIRVVKQRFPRTQIKVCMWFSDESLKKNKRYYLEQIANNTDDSVEISLYYGKELFEILFSRADIWDELIAHLKENKRQRSAEILSVPDFDTSDEIKMALLRVKREYPKLIKNLLSNKAQFTELRAELFPTGRNLQGL